MQVAASNTFSIRVTKSRLAKGLLAIPRKYAHLFPPEKCHVNVVFDDEDEMEQKWYLPNDKKVKERRLFGLSHWFARRDVKPGDRLTITLEGVETGTRTYRVALESYIQAKRRRNARQTLKLARTDGAALESFEQLVQLTNRRRSLIAREELLRIAREDSYQPRPLMSASRTQRSGHVPSGIRILLRELHEGKCQICSFTFRKTNGEPFFEIHHLDPNVGHHPANLLLLCANCHAQFEHAVVSDYERVGGWLVAVRINGKRFALRQPLSIEPLAHLDSVLRLLFIVAYAGLVAACNWRA